MYATSDAHYIQKIVDQAPGMVYQFVMNPAGEMFFTYVSEKSFEIYEMSRDEFEKNPKVFLDHVYADDQENLMKDIQTSAKGLTLFEWTGRITTASGIVKWVKVSSFPQKHDDGNIIWDGILVDVTREKKLEMELNQQRQATYHAARLAHIGELAVNISHEVLNPLTVLMGKIDILKMNLEKGNVTAEELEQSLTIQREACNHINRIAESLKNFSYMPNKPGTEGCLDKAIDNVVNLIGDVYARDGINVKVNGLKPAIKVACKTDLIQQVLFNLLKNAYDAVVERDDKVISVDLKVDSKQAHVTVTDNGLGISPENLDHIFDNFFTTKAYGKGSGLGLYIAKSILNACGGTIDCKSKLNQGSVFFVTIPILK